MRHGDAYDADISRKHLPAKSVSKAMFPIKRTGCRRSPRRVIPAKAGIQSEHASETKRLDSGFHRNDEGWGLPAGRHAWNKLQRGQSGTATAGFERR
jgi:hypothetical protein